MSRGPEISIVGCGICQDYVSHYMSRKLYESQTICHGVPGEGRWNACDVAYVNHDLFESQTVSVTIYMNHELHATGSRESNYAMPVV